MTMTETPTLGRQAEVQAVIRFTDPASAGAVLNSHDHESSTFTLIPRTVPIRDARAAGGLSFDRNGFTLVRHETDVDLLDRDAVQSRYYPQAEGIVRSLTGASEVIVFLDVIRSEARGQGDEPANNAHIDFDRPSLEGWVRMLRPADADRLLRKRMINLNLWRALRPVERMPLAVCDASSVQPGDLVRTLINRKGLEGSSHFAGFNLAYNPAQRWYYFPQMQPDEVLAFKLFDSEPDRPHLTAHTAFVDPTSRPDAPPRLSHEVRAIAFLD